MVPIRRYLNDKGMTVVVMKYRAPRPEGLAKHTTAWQDLQRVIRIVRSEAPSYGLDPDRIGIMGSSAGGHLTLMGTTSARHASYRKIDELDAPEFSFDLDTAPMLFIHGDADRWSAMNSVKTWEQHRAMGIQSELHTLALRGHCFQQKASPGTGSYTWMDRIWEFLTAKGFNR